MPQELDFRRTCKYCGAEDVERLGPCSVCGQLVCEKCGCWQHSMGEKRPTHNKCVHTDDSGFSMIKFVK